MPNPNNLTYFTFLQWNCRSLTANLEDLAFLLSSHSPDIICLSDIWLKNSSRFSFPGFHIIASHRTGPGGGAAILVTRNLSFSVINNTRIKNLCSSNNIHIPIVRISLNDKPTYIVFLYSPPPSISSNHPTSPNLWFDLFSLLSLFPSTLICADFNGRHPLWCLSHQIPDRTGSLIVNVLLPFDFVILNNGAPTRLVLPGW